MLATVAAADSPSTIRKKFSVFIYSEAEPHVMYAIYKQTCTLWVLQYIVFRNFIEPEMTYQGKSMEQWVEKLCLEIPWIGANIKSYLSSGSSNSGMYGMYKHPVSSHYRTLLPIQSWIAKNYIILISHKRWHDINCYPSSKR